MKWAISFAILLLVSASAGAATKTCTFAWDHAPTEADTAGFRLYTSMQSGAYAKGTPAHEAPGSNTRGAVVSCDERSYWVATAFDTSGNESDFSNEVQVADTTAPPPPGFRLEKVEITTSITEHTTRIVRADQ